MGCESPGLFEASEPVIFVHIGHIITFHPELSRTIIREQLDQGSAYLAELDAGRFQVISLKGWLGGFIQFFRPSMTATADFLVGNWLLRLRNIAIKVID